MSSGWSLPSFNLIIWAPYLVIWASFGLCLLPLPADMCEYVSCACVELVPSLFSRGYAIIF